VIGAGTMGGGIAMNFANAGIPVSIMDMTLEAVDKGLAKIKANYASTVSKGRLKQEEMDKRMALIKPTTGWRTARTPTSSSRRCSSAWTSSRTCSASWMRS